MEPRVKADKAWDFYEHQAPNVFSITHADALVLGNDPETVAQFPNEIFGKGPDAYVASLDSLHKLHCVNEIRKMTFEDY